MKLSLGLMSGTSMDGIDAALIRTDGIDQVESIASAFYPYDNSFRTALKSAEQHAKAHEGDLTGLENVIQESTRLHLEAAKSLMAAQELSSQEIELVGYHGQTFYHAPQHKKTIQAGNAQSLANDLHIPVVSEFRLNDVINGGQGAPFVPIYHWALAEHHGLIPLAILNCGGIANITLIPDQDPNHMLAYDLGPGNVLLDRFVREKTHHQKYFDEDGALALSGKVNAAVLAELSQKAIEGGFFEKQPPKSLDSHDCKLLPSISALSLEDGCATLAAFTAHVMAEQALRFTQHPPKRWVLAGGGWHNPVILREFKQALENRLREKSEIVTAKQVGWQQDALEAEAFAYLAKRVSMGLPISFPGTTGVSAPLTGGKIFNPER